MGHAFLTESSSSDWTVVGSLQVRWIISCLRSGIVIILVVDMDGGRFGTSFGPTVVLFPCSFITSLFVSLTLYSPLARVYFVARVYMMDILVGAAASLIRTPNPARAA